MSARSRFQDRVVWGFLLFGGVAVLGSVYAYWGLASDAADRLLIPLASISLIVRQWNDLRALPRRCDWFGFLVLLPLPILMPPAWYLVAQVGPRPVLLWWATGGWLIACAGALLAAWGWRVSTAIAFPLVFLVLALPLPQRIEQPLQNALQECTTTLSAKILSSLGIAASRQGFVLRLPSGEMGVLEACSGVKSLTALTAIAAFVACWRGFRTIRGAVLLALTVPVIVGCNVGRVVMSGFLQEQFGPSAIKGTAHELLGYVSVLVGLAAILGISQWMRPKHVTAAAIPLPGKPVRPWVGWTVAVLLGTTLTLSVAGFAAGRRTVEIQYETAPLDDIPNRVGGWEGEDSPCPDEVREMLTCDRILHRIYRNPIGQEIHVWVIYWAGAGSVRGYHHPDVCWPNRGFKATATGRRDLPLASGKSLSVTFREFQTETERQAICYWTQEGNRIWNDADEEAAYLEGTPRHRWVRERLSGSPAKRSARVAVLIGGDLWGSGRSAERGVWNFCALFATELFRTVPWANPDVSP